MGAPPAAQDEHAHGGLWARGHARRRGNDHPGSLPVTTRVVLYHAPACHLCERARATLAGLAPELGLELAEVDISGNPELEAQYREWLPVVEIDGERAFVYHVDPAALRRRIARTKSRTRH